MVVTADSRLKRLVDTRDLVLSHVWIALTLELVASIINTYRYDNRENQFLMWGLNLCLVFCLKVHKLRQFTGIAGLTQFLEHDFL